MEKTQVVDISQFGNDKKRIIEEYKTTISNKFEKMNEIYDANRLYSKFNMGEHIGFVLLAIEEVKMFYDSKDDYNKYYESVIKKCKNYKLLFSNNVKNKPVNCV